MGRKIVIPIIGDDSSYRRALGRAQTRSQKFGAIAKTAGITAAGGLGVAAVASVKLAVDFEASMGKIRALVGASDKQMEEYKEGVLDLAKTVPQGPMALADALYFVTSAGFKGAEALDVLKASARAAAAGLGDTATVADAVTSAVNAYGIKALKAERATDILLATVREGKAEPQELAEAIGRVIAPAEAMGVTFDEVGGAVAGLSLTGLDAEEAVTALRGTLASFLKPTQEATKFVENAGLSMEGLRKQIDQKGLLATLQMLRDRFGDNKEALAKLFPNVRALNGFLALTGRNAEKNVEVQRRVTAAVGDTDRAYAKASDTVQFKASKAWSTIQVAMIRFGNSALPVIAKVIDAITAFIDAINKLHAVTRSAMVRVKDAFISAISFMLGAISNFLRGLSDVLHAAGKMPGPLGAPFRKAAEAVDAATQRVDNLQDHINSLHSKTIHINAVVYGLSYVSELQRELNGLKGRNVVVGVSARQHGGPVSAGSPYVVGERGPELFVPRGAGDIVPNGRMAAAGGGGGGTYMILADSQVVSFLERVYGRHSKRNGY